MTTMTIRGLNYCLLRQSIKMLKYQNFPSMSRYFYRGATFGTSATYFPVFFLKAKERGKCTKDKR